jgi:outer membrane protein assembly factor BamD
MGASNYLKEEGTMKKIVVFLAAMLLVGCATTKTDKYIRYRGMSDEQLYTNSQQAIVKGHLRDATDSLEALDFMYPFGPYSRQGRLDIIYAYYLSKDQASALAAADRYLRLYPQGPSADYATYMEGLINYEMGESWLRQRFHIDSALVDLSTKKQAYASFSTVVTNFPGSPYAHDSALRMAYIRNMLARKNIDIAKFYYARKAYVASANRAAYVVAHYEGSPEVLPALAIMIKSYRAMGLTAMADKTLRLLQNSYPNSKELRNINNKKVPY